MTGGSLAGGTLNGNLWLVGGGDPSLSTGTFSHKAWGGTSGPARPARPGGAGRRDHHASPAASSATRAASTSRRTAPFWKPTYWRDCPPISALSVNMDLWTFGSPEAAPNPAQHAARLFRAALIGAGVKVGGGAGARRARPSTVHVVASEQSPAMARLVHADGSRARSTTTPRC